MCLFLKLITNVSQMSTFIQSRGMYFIYVINNSKVIVRKLI